jgi:hypothetical protein
MPPGAYGGQPMAAQPQNGMGIAALVLGILGLIGCLPLVGGILGIVFGRMGMAKSDQGLATNGGMAKAGFVIGVIALVLGVLGFLLIAVTGSWSWSISG